MNLLSLTGTFGAMVWIFQDGHFADLLGFTPTGTIASTMPVMMFCIAFGLERAGRIVSSAAVLMAVVFAAMLTSGMAMLKLLGLGMAVAVLVDAFLVRGTLVPAFMKLAGRANWWAPAPLRRLHDRFGIPEHDAGTDAEPAPLPVLVA